MTGVVAVMACIGTSGCGGAADGGASGPRAHAPGQDESATRVSEREEKRSAAAAVVDYTRAVRSHNTAAACRKLYPTSFGEPGYPRYGEFLAKCRTNLRPWVRGVDLLLVKVESVRLSRGPAKIAGVERSAVAQLASARARGGRGHVSVPLVKFRGDWKIEFRVQ